MNEVISIHLGGAGCRLGLEYWKQLCLEHGISPDGQPSAAADSDQSHVHSVFTTIGSGRYEARAMFIDLEPLAIDRVRTSTHHELFFAEQLKGGRHWAAGNFARGRGPIARGLVDESMHTLRRRLAPACDNLGGFLVTVSVDGGSGAGLAANILEQLGAEFPGIPRMVFAIFGTERQSAYITAPYNIALATRALHEHADLVIATTSSGVVNTLNVNLGIKRPDYGTMNRVLAQVLSSITAPMRFGGTVNADIHALQDNLMTTQHGKFIIPSYAPILKTDVSPGAPWTLADTARAVFESEYRLCGPDMRLKEWPAKTANASTLTFGGDVALGDVEDALAQLASSGVSVPTNLKTGVHHHPMVRSPESLLAPTGHAALLLANSPTTSDLFGDVLTSFDTMFNARMFVHHYTGEGLDESELAAARANLVALSAG